MTRYICIVSFVHSYDKAKQNTQFLRVMFQNLQQKHEKCEIIMWDIVAIGNTRTAHPLKKGQL